MNTNPPMHWDVTTVRRAGTYHETRGETCQDFTAVAHNGAVTAIALADGAGSCSRAEDGARIAAEITAQLLARDAGAIGELKRYRYPALCADDRAHGAGRILLG